MSLEWILGFIEDKSSREDHMEICSVILEIYFNSYYCLSSYMFSILFTFLCHLINFKDVNMVYFEF